MYRRSLCWFYLPVASYSSKTSDFDNVASPHISFFKLIFSWKMKNFNTIQSALKSDKWSEVISLVYWYKSRKLRWKKKYLYKRPWQTILNKILVMHITFHNAWFHAWSIIKKQIYTVFSNTLRGKAKRYYDIHVHVLISDGKALFRNTRSDSLWQHLKK